MESGHCDRVENAHDVKYRNIVSKGLHMRITYMLWDSLLVQGVKLLPHWHRFDWFELRLLSVELHILSCLYMGFLRALESPLPPKPGRWNGFFYCFAEQKNKKICNWKIWSWALQYLLAALLSPHQHQAWGFPLFVGFMIFRAVLLNFVL